MSRPEFFATPGYGDELEKELHYSQAVRIGGRVETSGQGGWNDDLTVPASLEQEIRQAFDNVERTLAAAGSTWTDVVHVNTYHVLGDDSFADHNEVIVEQFRTRMGARAPVWTETAVTALGDPKMRIEIRVTAVDATAD